jgi:hypothetical protein
MKLQNVLIVFFLLFSLSMQAQIFSDTLILNMQQTIRDLKQKDDDIRNRLEMQGRAVNDIARNQSLTDKTKWEKIRLNLQRSVEVYKILSDDIIDLKSQVINQDYQGYIKKLSSVENSPLGFSFEQVILKIAQNKAIFNKKAKNEKFQNTLKALKDSPIVGLIPFASQAVSLSSSAINVAYAAGMQDKKTNFDKIKDFEKELSRYIGFYANLDKANILNQSNSNQIVTLLEALQVDLLDKFKKDAYKLGFIPRDQRPEETIDDYFNYMTAEFSGEFIRRRIGEIEGKYTPKDGKMNIGELLQMELDVRHVNNNLDYLQDLCQKFINTHDQYFDLENRYYEQVKSAINIAKSNGIIEAVGDKTKDMVYDELLRELNGRKKKKDAAIKSSINIKELKEKMDTVDIYKIL